MGDSDQTGGGARSFPPVPWLRSNRKVMTDGSLNFLRQQETLGVWPGGRDRADAIIKARDALQNQGLPSNALGLWREIPAAPAFDVPWFASAWNALKPDPDPGAWGEEVNGAHCPGRQATAAELSLPCYFSGDEGSVPCSAVFQFAKLNPDAPDFPLGWRADNIRAWVAAARSAIINTLRHCWMHSYAPVLALSGERIYAVGALLTATVWMEEWELYAWLALGGPERWSTHRCGWSSGNIPAQPEEEPEPPEAEPDEVDGDEAAIHVAERGFLFLRPADPIIDLTDAAVSRSWSGPWTPQSRP